MISKTNLILIALILLNSSSLFGQMTNCYDSIMTFDGLTFQGYYGLNDFYKADSDLPVSFNSLTIRFDSSNRFYADAGNGFSFITIFG